MATTHIQKLADLASTTLASYAYFNRGNAFDAQLMLDGKQFGVGMTEVQKDSFTDRYALIHQHPNDPSGFSATLFYDKIDKKYVLAMRGTEFQVLDQRIPDFASADVGGIGLNGFANLQAIDMYRYFKRLTTAGGQQVQYSPRRADSFTVRRMKTMCQ